MRASRFVGCLVVVLALVGAGCGEESSAPSTCAMSASFTGGLSGSSSGDPACLTSFAGSSSIDGSFVFLSGPIDTVELEIDDVDMGETGSTFPAMVRVTARDGGRWTGTCAAAVTGHVLYGPAELGDRYRAEGTVTCATPLVSDDGSPAATVTHLDFVMTSTWP